eukprot:7288822-Prymnesium_polylepis.1
MQVEEAVEGGDDAVFDSDSIHGSPSERGQSGRDSMDVEALLRSSSSYVLSSVESTVSLVKKAPAERTTDSSD